MQLFDRLSYAAIGFFFGALIGFACWWVYGFKTHGALGHGHLSLSEWIKYSGGIFAAIGFILRDRVGDVVGGLIAAVYEAETTRFSWVILFIIALGIFLFFVFRNTFQ